MYGVRRYVRIGVGEDYSGLLLDSSPMNERTKLNELNLHTSSFSFFIFFFFFFFKKKNGIDGMDDLSAFDGN